MAICEFSIDSSLLFIVCHRGYVLGYDVMKNFQQMFKKQIHKRFIYNIRILQNQYLLTCSQDFSIIKTDIRLKKQLFKMNNTSVTQSIDCNQEGSLIISGSFDESINLWDTNNRSILINKKKGHPNPIHQIQLFNNHNNLLSLDANHNLYKWNIDLQQKSLIQIQIFTDEMRIMNFYQINNGQNLVLISWKYVKIINNQGNIINQFYHQARFDICSFICESRQLNNRNYIHIRSEQQLMIAKRTKQSN